MESTGKAAGKTKNTIFIKILSVIIVTAVIINISVLMIGALFLLNSISGGLGDIFNSLIFMGLISLVLSIAAAIVAASILKRPYEDAENLRKTAEAASHSKSAFIATISHEIRTPMNSIMGFSELALDGETSLKTRDYLNKIKTNAEWQLQIINDILDVSKVESGRMSLENIPFDMHELFASCRTIMLPKAIEKGIILYFYVEPSIGRRPLGDPIKLRQVLINLLSNAVKFTNTGMVKLHAVLKEVKDKSITMAFEIKDSGIGMTPEQIDKIFLPYVQADTGTARKFGGTGLGLAITKNIVEMMGGKLTVESTAGIGSKFSFEIIFETIDHADDDIFNKNIVINELEKPVFSGDVLLCEDTEMNQQVIFEHLARVGIKAVIAENGKAGYEAVKDRMEKNEKQFDLIFMDIHMPVMDGLEAAAKITELNLGIPIVAMTANIMYNDREIYRKSGMYDCVGKPFTSQELWRCLMKYFTPLSFGALDAVNVSGKDKQTSDWEYQVKLQKLFVQNNRNKYDEITEALEAGDISKAHRMAHSLKSNAEQIGKIILLKAAADIEYRLKDGKNMVTGEHLKMLKTELDLILNEFNQNI